MGASTTPGHDAVAELEGLELGDSRRAARVRSIVAALQVDPAAHFPTTMRTESELEALYRILNNDAVICDALLAPHAAQTAGRMAALAGRPLVVVDKTAFVFNGEIVVCTGEALSSCH